MSKIRSFLRIVLYAGCICALVLAAGCGQADVKDAEVTTVSVNKNGSVSGLIVEDFSKPYYDQGEMQTQIAKEIGDYNQKAGNDRVTAGEITKEGQSVRLAMDYVGTEDYAAFNQVTLFYGTVDEAAAAGYSLPSDMADSGGAAISDGARKEIGSSHILIASEKCHFMVPYRIAYVSGGVKIVSSREADAGNATGDLSFMVMAD